MPAPLILVVEDNPITEKILRLSLESDGYDVLAARDGTTALSLTEGRCPDLILQDLILPDLCGFDLVSRMRARPGWEAIPILAFSGFVTALEEARVSTNGFDDFISKPIEPSRLLDIVRTYLPRRAPWAGDRFGGGRRLLLADDDPVQLRMISLRLGRAGFEVMTAADGVEALERARMFRPDVIVTDVIMPRLDGYGLCLAVREEPRLANVRLLLVTPGHVEETDRDLGRRAGADDHVVRRPDLSEIVEALRAILGRPAHPSHAAAVRIGELDHDRADRVIRQLERQVALHAGEAQRSATLAAKLSILSGISEALSRSSDLGAALGEALATSLDAGGISRGALFLRGPTGDFAPAGQAGFDGDGAALAELAAHGELFSGAGEDARPIAVRADSEPSEAGALLLAAARARSVLLVPILVQGERLGALLFASESKDLSDGDWLTFATAIARQMGQALALARAFERVSESEARFRCLVDSMEDVVFTLDREQRWTGVYGRGLAAHGGTSQELLGRTARQLMGAGAAAPHERANARALAGETATYEWQGASPVAMCHFQTVVSPLVDDKGRTLGVVGLTRDISEQRRIQAHLMASDRMASVGTLAAGIAHSINNPLASVLANLELAARDVAEVARGGGDIASAADEVRDAHEAAESVRQIVRDLKLFSRADENKVGPVDVGRVLESSLRIAWNEIRHRARLVRDYGDVPLAEANESRLGQVFLNLIVNAAQAIPEGHASANQIRVITSTDASGRVVVAVSDTGTGMTPEVREQLFTPFFTTKAPGAGTGLGLSICQRLVTGMGGEIAVESECGRGSVFRVTLPAASTAPEATSSARVDRAPRRRGRVLIVDDDVSLQNAITRALTGEHDVIALSSGREALDRVAAGERYDVILCDLMMPEMGGMDLHAGLLRAAPDQAGCMMFLTGGAFTPRARAFLKTIPNQRIEKPFDIQQLRALINERIG
ncbi:MAG TPA: response regulator [Kofleriaceae bacterium]|nr:response regulator [Kofleriaceae bacterium]